MPMKWVRWIIVTFCAIALLVYLISLLFQKELVAEHHLTIAAQKEVVFNHLNDLSKWPYWSAWKMNDTSIQLKYGSITKGAGASLEWKNMDGQGKVVLIHSIHDSLIDAEIVPDGWSTVYSQMTLSPTDSGTLVNWQMKTRPGNPVSRIMGYFFKGWMLRDIKRGLRGLNAWLINNGLTEGKILSIDYIKNPEKTYYSLILTDTLASLPGHSVLQQYFSTISHEMEKWDLQKAHDPFIHIRNWPVDSSLIIIDFGIPIKDFTPYKGHLNIQQHQHSVLSVQYVGSMHQWTMAIDSIKRYSAALSLKIDSDPYITFLSTPIENGIYKGTYPNLISLFVKEEN
jgi:hypothetical protein